MGVVTVYGANGSQVQVTVDGGRAQLLAQSYADQIATAFAGGSLTSNNFVVGDNVAPEATAGQLYQGVITMGGSFNAIGGISHLVIGAGAPLGSDPENPEAPLSDRVTVNASAVTSSFLKVLSGDMAGIDFTVGNYDGIFDATFGNNVFRGAGTTGNWEIVTGPGNDTIFGTNGVNIIDAGAGNNSIYLGTGTNTVALRGQDTLIGTLSSKTDVTIYGGSSNLQLGGNAYVADIASVGSYISIGVDGTVSGGNGSTLAFTGASGTVLNTSGDTISASGNLYVKEGLNQSISVDGALTFINGSGNTQITTKDGTVYGSQGLSLLLNVSKHLIYTTNQPGSTGDQYVDGSLSSGWVEYWTGPGNQSIIGGTGYNHFVFGTAFEGTSGDSYATVSAAHGLSDFGVLRGHSGGHITIQDFLSNADNKFFMYNYKPSNSAEEVQKLLNTAVVSGNNTTITLDNNMTVTFVGITQLNAANFVIS